MQPGLFQPEKAPPVLSAQLGDLGGAIGAALLAAPAESAWRVEPALRSAG
jgi:hypothetical protein